MNKNKLNYLDEPMKVIGKVDPKLKARIDRVQAQLELLYTEDVPAGVVRNKNWLEAWDALTRKLYELVRMI